MPNIDMIQLRTDIKNDEGVVLHAYPDSLGYLTIGSGILIDQRKGGGIKESENDFILDTRLSQLLNDMDLKLPWLVGKSDGIQRALCNMAWQLGLNGLLQFTGMLSSIKNGDYPAAAEHALDSLWAKQTPQRAARIAALISEG